MELPFPRDICAHITRYNCYRPTPSAKAINQYLDLYPWLVPMMLEFPTVPPIHMIMKASTIGLRDCYVCKDCCVAKLYRIRQTADQQNNQLQ